MEASQLPPGRRCVKVLEKSVVDTFVELQASIFLQAENSPHFSTARLGDEAEHPYWLVSKCI